MKRALILLLLLTGCDNSDLYEKRRRNEATTGNPGISDTVIATVEGCRVHYLRGDGHSVYAVICGDGRVRAHHEWTETQGKQTVRKTQDTETVTR